MSRRREWTSSDVSWQGGMAPYDLIKEAVIAIAAVAVLAIVLTVLFSAPDPKPVTMRSWAQADPSDFVTTALSELDGTSGTATYGPPYNDNGTAQHLAFFKPAQWVGVQVPINTAKDFVIAPLRTVPDPGVQVAASAYERAPARVQAAWTTAYGKALAKAKFAGGAVILPAGTYGPVGPMMASLYRYALSGGLDGSFHSTPLFYSEDYTKPLLFMGDSTFVDDKATADHINGDQWGIMNEVGQFPGAWWLFPYTAPYQFKPGSTSPNADLLVFAVVGGISLLFIFLPWVPGLRDIPRLTRVYRLIWREHYRRVEAAGGTPS